MDEDEIDMAGQSDKLPRVVSRARQETMKKAKNRGGELRDQKVADPLMIFVISKFPRRVVECNILLLLFLYFLCVIFSLVLVLLQLVSLVLVGTALVQRRKRLWISGLLGWI
jgi:hypothetical protein